MSYPQSVQTKGSGALHSAGRSDPLKEIMPDGGNLFQRECRQCRSLRADQYASAAQIGCRAEAFLVGHIIANEERRASSHGSFAHECPHGSALVGPAWTQFKQHLAWLDDQVQAFSQSGRQIAGFIAPLRCASEMQADTDCLAFDKDASLPIREVVEGGFRFIDLGKAARGLGRAAGLGELAPVGACQQKMFETEFPQRRDGAAADDGEPAGQIIPQTTEQGQEIGIHYDPVGRVGYRRKGAVEIKEQRCARQQFGRRRREVGG